MSNFKVTDKKPMKTVSKNIILGKLKKKLIIKTKELIPSLRESPLWNYLREQL
jgi:hypothetical protein